MTVLVREILAAVGTSQRGQRMTLKWVTMLIGFGLLAAATTRLVIAFSGASVVGTSDQGFSTLDILLLSLVVTVGLIAVVSGAVLLAYRRTTALAKAANPTARILPVGIRSEEIDLVKKYGHESGLRLSSLCVIAVTADEITWWTGLIETRSVAELRSDIPIEFRIGEYVHGLRSWKGILATFTQGNDRFTMPIPIAPDRLVPIPPNADALAVTVRELESIRA